MEKLKPCPFCGAKPYMAKNYLGQKYVRCLECGACVWGKDTDCVSYVPKVYPKPYTNYDRIVSKSMEELAKWLSFLAPCCHCEAVPEERNQVIHPHNCCEKWLDWLKQEAKDD